MSIHHGEAARGRRSPEYSAWHGMIARCHSQNNKRYSYYGARGITVCDRWRESFEAFLSDMGRRPYPRYSIERLDNDSGYAPWNCKWATRSEQMRNTRYNVNITIDGETMCMKAGAERFGMVSHKIASKRIRNLGWSPVDAVRLPPTPSGTTGCIARRTKGRR